MTATLTEAPVKVKPVRYDDALAAALADVERNTGHKFTAVPTALSPIPADTDVSAVFEGAKLLGLPVTPQGIMVAGMLEAKKPNGLPLYSRGTVQIPRRGAKTTTIMMVVLGRCANREDYRVVSTAQDGTRASGILQNLFRVIDRRLSREHKELEDYGIKQLYRSQGREYIEWLNGSKWWCVKPDSGAFRSEAADVEWFDEGGELDPETSEDLKSGALPLMDTRPDGQIIVSGTPGQIRAGLFWEYLEKSREAPERRGIVDFSLGDFAPLYLLDEDGEVTDAPDEELWWTFHPGLACGLTTLEVLQERWEDMKSQPGSFFREYGCIWPPDSTVTALDLQKWGATTGVHVATPPDGVPFGVGWDVAIGGSAAAVAVAWFDADDEPHVQVMKHKQGSQWVAKDAALALLKHPRVPVAYDNIGDNIAVAQALGRMEALRNSHKKRIKPLNMKEVAAATAVVAMHNELLTLHHAKHPGLDKAVENAAWRDSGGSRLFMRLKGMEITCLLACVHALAAAATAKRAGKAVMPDVAT